MLYHACRVDHTGRTGRTGRVSLRLEVKKIKCKFEKNNVSTHSSQEMQKNKLLFEIEMNCVYWLFVRHLRIE